MSKEEYHHRLTQSIEYLRNNGQALSQSEISQRSGIRQPHVSGMVNGNHLRLTEGNLRKFADAYSDYINADWLLTGEGKMEVPDKSLRPHVGVKAAAGFMSGIADSDSGNDLRYRIPFIPDYDFTIYADGESMQPKIEDGDILACRIADDRANPPIGKICVIDSNEGAVVKILKGVEDEKLILHSINPEYADYAVLASEVNNIAVVVGMVSNMA